MTIAELKAREAEIRASDIAEANRAASREKAISHLMLSGRGLQDAQREFNEQVAYFMRGLDGYDRPDAIDAAIEVILYGDDMTDDYTLMLDLVHN